MNMETSNDTNGGGVPAHSRSEDRSSFPSRSRDRSLTPRRGRYSPDRRDPGYRREKTRSRSPYREERGGYPPRDERAYTRDRHDRHDDRGRGGYDDRGRGGYDRGYEERGHGGAYGGRHGGGYSRGGYGGYRGPPRRREVDRGSDEERRSSTTLYVGKLPYSFREPQVLELFERCGRIRKVTVQLDPYTGKNKGYCFVEFEERRDAEDAFDKYDGYTVEGCRLKLDWDIGQAKKDAHRGRAPLGDYSSNGPSSGPADPYSRDAPPPRRYSPDYGLGGGREHSPYRR